MTPPQFQRAVAAAGGDLDDKPQTEARCPRCGKRTATPHGDRQTEFYCHHCKMAFDAEPDGDIGYGGPDRRLLREERRAERKARR